MGRMDEEGDLDCGWEGSAVSSFGRTPANGEAAVMVEYGQLVMVLLRRRRVGCRPQPRVTPERSIVLVVLVIISVACCCLVVDDSVAFLVLLPTFSLPSFLVLRGVEGANGSDLCS